MRLTLLSASLFATGIASAAAPVDGWYTSLFAGYTYLSNNLNIYRFGRHFSDADYRNAYNVGGRIGYQSNPIRYEGEYTYIHANPKNFKINGFRQRGVSGGTTANLVMVNIYYDTPEILPAMAPFLGVGIGYAFVQSTVNSTGPFALTYFSGNDNAFAYQGTVGLTYNFAENYALNASYRYTATASSGRFGRTFQAQMGDIGVIYRFDNCNYK